MDVTGQDVEAILKGARWAPSAMNLQLWAFIAGCAEMTRTTR
ncbi:MAG: nitroreductase family protein [Actinomycetaceae bacterium]|nr:nitroreductase family protein [Actinomycetaceae bacterium]